MDIEEYFDEYDEEHGSQAERYSTLSARVENLLNDAKRCMRWVVLKTKCYGDEEEHTLEDIASDVARWAVPEDDHNLEVLAERSPEITGHFPDDEPGHIAFDNIRTRLVAHLEKELCKNLEEMDRPLE